MNTNHRASRRSKVVRRWLTAEMLALLLFAAQLATQPRTTSASVSNTPVPRLAANGRIAFTSDRDGNREIYLMNADGTNQVRLTNNSVVDDHPNWSPDGTKIAFVSQRPSGAFAICQMNADGTDKVEITPLSNFVNLPPDGVIGFSMSWSPDGRKITYQDGITGYFPAYNDIYVVDVETGIQQNLTNDGGGSLVERLDFNPAWSPDGSTILYASHRFNGVCPSLFAMNPDGTNRRLLSGNHCPAYSPSWSPDSTKIVFVELNNENVESELRVANSDGTNVRIFDGGVPDPKNRDYPRWSPDGNKIIFNMTDNPTSNDIEIYLKNVDGTGYAQLTNTIGARNYRPSWQPLLSAACPNPIDCADFFVHQHYLDFLNREPDLAGYAGWQSMLTNCPVGDTTCDRIHVSSAFFRSPEFQGRGYFVYRFYPVSFGRKPDYAEFTPDLAKVSGFLTDAELEAAKVAFITEFMNRPAFVTKFNGLDNTQYVDALLVTADITHPARDSWIAALTNGSRTRAQVLREISESTEVYNKYYNQAFVVMQYFGYLHRQPDALYLNWIAHLDATGDYRSMIDGFVSSLEYRARFAR